MGMVAASESQSPVDWAHHTDLTVGEILRRTREHYGLTLPQVESILRIRACQLEALELDDVSRLPGRVYAIGFVRAYAEYLGLDGDKMVHLFKTQSVGNRPRPELSFPAAASESKLPNKYVLTASFVAFIALASAWVVMNDRQNTVVSDIPPVPKTMKMDVAKLDTKMPLQAAVLAAIEPAAGKAEFMRQVKDQIVVNVTQSAWVEIRNAEGKALISQVLNPGDSYTVPAEDGLVMDTGNAGGLEITINGIKTQPLGKSGDVVRAIALDSQSLKKIEIIPETVQKSGS